MLLKWDGQSIAKSVLIGGILLMTAAIGGCSAGSTKVEPVRIAGKVTTSDGAPVRGVRLILAPDDSKNVLSTFGFDLDQEGHFEGQALPGSYGFYFAPVAVERDGDDGLPVNKSEAKKLKDSTASLNKSVPPAYRSPKTAGANGKVEVAAGADINVVLSK